MARSNALEIAKEDPDFLAKLAARMNRTIPCPERIVPYDCLRQVGRHTGGQNYKELANAIKRLTATLVITNIR